MNRKKYRDAYGTIFFSNAITENKNFFDSRSYYEKLEINKEKILIYKGKEMIFFLKLSHYIIII